ncbi:Rsm22-domain-containing protein [Neoconidiobolus thromboides FSU 785]|nr:Rsm22-domain-containing protein [Neoconidiobolus thromboides FSU 785]
MEDIKHNALKIFTSYSSLLPTSNTITRAAKLIQKQHQRPNLPISKPHLLTYDKNETLAYIAAIMPGFYGCTHKVLSELQVRAPKLKPKRILDFGTGPGTSLWAAKDIFGSENIEYYHGVDLSEAMLETAEKLIKLNHDQEDSFKGKVRLERHFSYNPNEEKYDIVMAAYSLGELPSDILRQKAILELIERSRDTVVIIEKGTTRGFEIINQARELLNTNEMESCYILAPCPHSNICPKKGTTRWCHFEQKVQRPKFTMDAKSSKSNVEHSNYSYLIIQKGNKPEYIENAKNDQEWLNQSLYWSRILDHPKKKGSHVLMNLCDKDGNIYNSVFPSSQGKKIFRDARKSKRGDLFPHEPKTKTVIVDMKKNTIDLPKHKKEDSDLEE